MRAAAVLLALSALARAAVTLDPMLGDHMVLQRDQPIVIRGTAKPGETVRVRLASEQVAVTAGAEVDVTASSSPSAIRSTRPKIGVGSGAEATR